MYRTEVGIEFLKEADRF